MKFSAPSRTSIWEPAPVSLDRAHLEVVGGRPHLGVGVGLLGLHRFQLLLDGSQLDACLVVLLDDDSSS